MSQYIKCLMVLPIWKSWSVIKKDVFKRVKMNFAFKTLFGDFSKNGLIFREPIEVICLEYLKWCISELMLLISRSYTGIFWNNERVIQTGLFLLLLCKGQRNWNEEDNRGKKRGKSEYCINTDVNSALISILCNSDFTCSQKKVHFPPNALSHHIHSSPWLLYLSNVK